MNAAQKPTVTPTSSQALRKAAPAAENPKPQAPAAGASLCPCCLQVLPVNDDLIVDEAGIIIRQGHYATLTEKEMALFEQLYAAQGRVVGRGRLLSGLYLHDGDETEIKIIDVFICKIRRKLQPLGVEIGTVWGRGYRLVTQARRSA